MSLTLDRWPDLYHAEHAIMHAKRATKRSGFASKEAAVDHQQAESTRGQSYPAVRKDDKRKPNGNPSLHLEHLLIELRPCEVKSVG